jgi:hypothetical protein
MDFSRCNIWSLDFQVKRLLGRGQRVGELRYSVGVLVVRKRGPKE